MKIEAGGLKFELTDVPAVRRLDCMDSEWDSPSGDDSAWCIHLALISLEADGHEVTALLSHGALAAAWLDPVRQASNLWDRSLSEYWGLSVVVAPSPGVPDDLVVVINGSLDGEAITLADVFVILNVRMKYESMKDVPAIAARWTDAQVGSKGDGESVWTA